MTYLQVDEDTLYTFHVTHDKFEWTVKRKYKEFQELERDLQLRKMLFHLLPFERLVYVFISVMQISFLLHGDVHKIKSELL